MVHVDLIKKSSVRMIALSGGKTDHELFDIICIASDRVLGIWRTYASRG